MAMWWRGAELRREIEIRIIGDSVSFRLPLWLTKRVISPVRAVKLHAIVNGATDLQSASIVTRSVWADYLVWRIIYSIKNATGDLDLKLKRTSWTVTLGSFFGVGVGDY